MLAYAVVRGDLEASFVNLSAMLTQAYRGTGLLKEALPVQIIASYPSWDCFVIAVHPRTRITSLAQWKETHGPLRLSIRKNATHSTRVLIDQLLSIYSFTLAEAESWGCTLLLNDPPGDPRRLAAIREGSVDLVCDEGIGSWIDTTLKHSLQPLELEENVLRLLDALGWRRAFLPKSRFLHLDRDRVCIDHSGWLLHTRASLADEVAYQVCAAIAAHVDEILWDQNSYSGLD